MRMGVVAGGDEQIPTGTEGERAGVVAAFLALLLVGEQNPLRGGIEPPLPDREPAHPLAGEIGG